MPLAPVDHRGTVLYYEDCGPPPSSNDYSTIVVIHGTMFHRETFSRMKPFAGKHNIRLVLLNLRDYPGSTPFSREELEALHSPDKAVQAAMIENRGLELGAFLVWFIEKEKIPPLTNLPDGHASGGLSIVAWSSASAMTLSLFAHAHMMPTSSQDLLASYLRSHIMLDPPSIALGMPRPSLEEIYCPLYDPAIPESDMIERFCTWVSSYYLHSQVDPAQFSALSRDEFISSIAQTPIPNPPPHQLPTTKVMSAKELESVADIPGAARSHVSILLVDNTVYSENAFNALLGPSVWPNMRTILVLCEMTQGYSLLGAWGFAQMIATRDCDAGRTEMSLNLMKGVNHFPSWEDPERTVAHFASIV